MRQKYLVFCDNLCREKSNSLYDYSSKLWQIDWKNYMYHKIVTYDQSGKCNKRSSRNITYSSYYLCDEVQSCIELQYLL